MFKCLDCGHVFETPDEFRENHGDPGKGYESFGVCPECSSDDYEEVEQCSECGEWFSPDELYSCGCCESCLQDLMTVDNFLDFATTGTVCGTDVDVLEDFVLRDIFDVNGHDTVLTCSSVKFKDFCRQIYTLCKSERDLLDRIKTYISDSCLWCEFAEYIETKGGKKDEEKGCTGSDVYGNLHS